MDVERAKCCGSCRNGRSTAWSHHAVVCEKGHRNPETSVSGALTYDIDICPGAVDFEARDAGTAERSE